MGDPRDESTDALRNVGALEAAEQRAFERGMNSAKITGQVDAHEKRLNGLNGTLETQAAEFRNLANTVQKLGEDFRQSIVVAATRAQDAKALTERQVSNRTFMLGIIGAVVAIGSLLAATGHV